MGGFLILAQIHDFGIGAVHGFSDMLVGPSQEEHHGDHQFRPLLHLASTEQLRVFLSTSSSVAWKSRSAAQSGLSDRREMSSNFFQIFLAFWGSTKMTLLWRFFAEADSHYETLPRGNTAEFERGRATSSNFFVFFLF